MAQKSHIVHQAAKILNNAKSLFVLTGAGISAESGIPTFRGADGLWKNFKATDLATPEAFQKNPQLVWEWYHWRQDLILKTKPNPAHYAIVELEQKFGNFLLLTQNVDNLHKNAGSQKVLEIHGNIFRARCLECGKICNHRIESDKEANKLPTCVCSGLLRPDVVWFGEPVPHDIWQTSLEFLSTADVALTCGTSGVVWPVAAIPEIANQNNVKTIEINLKPTPISRAVDIFLQGKAGDILPGLVKLLSR